VEKIVGKIVVTGVLAATLAVPSWAEGFNSQFSGPLAEVDGYNAVLGAIGIRPELHMVSLADAFGLLRARARPSQRHSPGLSCSSNANGLCGRVCALTNCNYCESQILSAIRHLRVRVSHAQPRSRVSASRSRTTTTPNSSWPTRRAGMVAARRLHRFHQADAVQVRHRYHAAGRFRRADSALLRET
jgi:hypothetical protein